LPIELKMGWTLAIVSLCLVQLGSSFLFAQNKWDGLSVTFGLNPLSSQYFSSLPRTEASAKSSGWTKISDCDTSSKFRGVRYVKDNDYAVVLLFDAQGHIAGQQAGVAVSELPTSYTFPPTQQRGQMFQLDNGRYFLTAYYTDPSTICSAGRSNAQFSTEGTGNGLWLQNSSNPEHSTKQPAREPSLAGTKWTHGKCFPAMGQHYWYNTAADMSCEDFQPVFLLYNEGVLNAFGWAMGLGQSSPRYEHPTPSVFSGFMDPVPKCLSDYPALSTMHIYLTKHPSLDLC